MDVQEAAQKYKMNEWLKIVRECRDTSTYDLTFMDLCSDYILRKKRSIRGQELVDDCRAVRIADFIEVHMSDF